MRICLVSQWYPPEPFSHLADLAGAWRKRGHDVDVLTAFPNYPSGTLYSGYRRHLVGRDEIDGTSIARVPTTLDQRPAVRPRLAKYGSFAIAATLFGPFAVPRPDVVFVYATPLTAALPALWLRPWWRAPVVVNVQDLWPETLEAVGGIRPGSRALRVLSRFARSVYRRADRLVVISEGFKRNLIGKGVPADRIDVVSNWVDTEKFRPLQPDAALAVRFGISGKFVVMFAGLIGRAQGLPVLLDAAERLRDDPSVQFALVGDGPNKAALESEAARRGLTNVTFLGRHPEEDMPALYSLADALLVHLRDDDVFGLTIPHKVFSYLASGRPVIAAAGGETAALIAAAGAGIVCRPDDGDAMAGAVRVLRHLPGDERRTLGARARETAVRSYGRDRLTGQIADVLEREAARGRSPSRRSVQ